MPHPSFLAFLSRGDFETNKKKLIFWGKSLNYDYVSPYFCIIKINKRIGKLNSCQIKCTVPVRTYFLIIPHFSPSEERIIVSRDANDSFQPNNTTRCDRVFTLEAGTASSSRCFPDDPSWKALIAVDREIIIRRAPSSENQSRGGWGFSLAGLVSIRC